MDGHTLILTAAIFSLVLICIAVRQRRIKKQLMQAFEQAANTKPQLDEGIVSKRVVGINPGHQTDTPSIEKQQKNDLIIFHVMAQRGQNFAGYELYQTLLDAEFKHNEYGIFEYIENIAGEPISLFSLASVVEPGTFDVSDIGRCICPGLSIFMRVNQPHVAMAFKLMLSKIEYLTEVLQAKVYDDKHQTCTQHYFNTCRTKVAEACERAPNEVIF